MINESRKYNNYTDGPESGGEEVTNTAEYLARLGVSNHFEEEQENTSSIAIDDDDDDESTDVLSEMGVSKSARYGVTGARKLRPRMGSSISTTGTIVQNDRSGDQFMCGSLNSIIQHNEEELSGSYNWDYLQHWGPKYQPLSSVFAEIAKLKTDDQQQPIQPSIAQGIAAEILESMSNRSTTSSVSSRTRGMRQTHPQHHQPQPNNMQQHHHQQQVHLQPHPPAVSMQQHPQYYAQYQPYSMQQAPPQAPSSLSNYQMYGMTQPMNPQVHVVHPPPGTASSASSSIYNR